MNLDVDEGLHKSILTSFLIEPYNYITLKTDIIDSIKTNCYLKSDQQKWLDLLDLILSNNHGFMSFLRHSKKPLCEWVINQLKEKAVSCVLAPSSSISTKVYWILTGLQTMPNCLFCKKQLQFKNIKSISHSLYQFCSITCSTRYFLPEVNATAIQKYGCVWNQKACIATWKKLFGERISNPM